MRSTRPLSLFAFRIFVVLSAVLLTVIVGVGFFAAPEIGSAYLMIVGSTGNDLPALTAVFSVFLCAVALAVIAGLALPMACM